MRQARAHRTFTANNDGDDEDEDHVKLSFSVFRLLLLLHFIGKNVNRTERKRECKRNEHPLELFSEKRVEEGKKCETLNYGGSKRQRQWCTIKNIHETSLSWQ